MQQDRSFFFAFKRISITFLRTFFFFLLLEQDSGGFKGGSIA